MIDLKLSWPQEPKLIASHRLNGDGYKIEPSRTEIAMSENSWSSSVAARFSTALVASCRVNGLVTIIAISLSH